MDIKAEAFVQIFNAYPDKIKEIVKFHLSNGGMSRVDKFKYIFKNIINRPLTTSRLNSLCDKFSEYVFAKVIKAPFIKGAQEFLEKNCERFNMYIVSATPQAELGMIIDKRRLRKYFQYILGFPPEKAKLIRRILRRYNRYSFSDTVFIGDSINDYNAAKEAGVRFIAKLPTNINKYEREIAAKLQSPENISIKDLFELDRYLLNH